jgi:hypothetical protein
MSIIIKTGVSARCNRNDKGGINMQLRNEALNSFNTIYDSRRVLVLESNYKKKNPVGSFLKKAKQKLKESYSKLAVFFGSNYTRIAFEDKLYDANYKRRHAQKSLYSKWVALMGSKCASKENSEPKESTLAKEINEVKRELEIVYTNFDYVVDPDMIDSNIYQMNAILNRYRFLLKQAKNKDSISYCISK